MKTEYTWIEYKQMMEDASYSYKNLKSFYTLLYYRDKKQLLELASILTKLATGK